MTDGLVPMLSHPRYQPHILYAIIFVELGWMQNSPTSLSNYYEQT